MGNSVERPALARRATVSAPTCEFGLYTRQGTRKYLTREESQRAIAIMARHNSDAGLLGLTIAWTGCRVSEALALTAHSFQVERGLVAIVTLKRRHLSVREVPIPHDLLMALDRRFSLTSSAHADGYTPRRLWTCCRATAWRHIKLVMAEAGISGRHACPRGLRHAFGVGTLQSGVPMTLLQKWMGHAHLSTTSIYADVSGPEERVFASVYWQWSRKVIA